MAAAGGCRHSGTMWARRGGLILVFSLACLVGLSTSAFATGQSAYQRIRANQPYSPGPQTCLKCHNSHPVTYILQTPMGVKGDSRTPFGQRGCETCHGPSGLHAELKMVDGRLILPPILFKKPKVNVGVGASPVAVRNQVCLSCHQGGMPLNWMGSPHQVNQLACTSCHTVHAPKDPVLVRLTQPQVCFKCHVQIRAMTYEYSHHPIREGRVVCSDCHNPMGSAGPHMLKEFTVNETCYNCHADKRGPFLWEHQPVRQSCLNCHTPHGSNQAHLLKEPLNFLCMSCHSANSHYSGGAFGGMASIPFGSQTGSSFVTAELANQRLCTNCHSQVHGSNSPAGAFFFR